MRLTVKLWVSSHLESHCANGPSFFRSAVVLVIGGLGTCLVAPALADPPAVIFNISATQSEDPLFGSSLQSVPYNYQGATPALNVALPTSQTDPNGIISGSDSLSISSSTALTNTATLSITHIAQLSYQQTVSGNPFFADQIGDQTGVTMYILGAPGTAYQLTYNAAASISPEVGSAGTIAYSSPGFAWGPVNFATTPTFSTTVTAQTNSTTIEYGGQTYSEIQIFPTTGVDAEWGTTEYVPAGFSINGTAQLTETIQVTDEALPANTVVPLPPSAYLMLSGVLGVFSLSYRPRKRRISIESL